jgi:hypothetical protein
VLNHPSQSVLWIETDPYGRVEDIAADAASLLGLSPRGAQSRDMRLFFPGSFGSVTDLLREAIFQTVEHTLELFPRDRKRLRVRVRIAPSPTPSSSSLLRWTIEPV